MLSAREKTLRLQGRRDEQAVDLDALAKLADALGDDHRRADVGLRSARHAMRMADWGAVMEATHKSLVFATRAGNDRLRLSPQRLKVGARKCFRATSKAAGGWPGKAWPKCEALG